MVITDSAYLILSELGLAAFGNDDELISSIKFNDPVSSYRLIRRSEAPEELMVFISRLNGYRTFVVNDSGIKSILDRLGLHSDMMTSDQMFRYETNRPEMLVRANLAASQHDAITKLRDFAISLSSNRVKETSERLDLHLIQSINALDEFDKLINVVGSRLREWYGLHFPELDNLVQSLNAYALIVREAGQRANITRQILQNAGMQDKKIDIILEAKDRSKGGDLAENNLEIIKKLADEVIIQSDLREMLADHVEALMTDLAPNTKELLTATVGARMIAKVGSFVKFAHLPASTVQILGAEKALFRSLKTGARPPKHGFLFQHPLIHSAPKWQRGKIARTVASKVSIVARIDLYRPGERDYAILEKMNSRIRAIQERYKNPPLNENAVDMSRGAGRRWSRDFRAAIHPGKIMRDNRPKRKDRRPHSRKRKRF